MSKRASGIPPIMSGNSLGLEEATSLLFGEASLPKQECDAQLHKVPQAKYLRGPLPGVGDLGRDEAPVAFAPPVPSVVAHPMGRHSRPAGRFADGETGVARSLLSCVVHHSIFIIVSKLPVKLRSPEGRGSARDNATGPTSRRSARRTAAV